MSQATIGISGAISFTSGSGGSGSITYEPGLPVSIGPGAASTPIPTSGNPQPTTSANLNWSVDTWNKTIPLTMGNRRIAGELIWAEAISYDVNGNAFASFAVSFGYPLDPNEYSALTCKRIWANGNLIYDGTASPAIGLPGMTFRFYPGSRFQSVDPLISSIRGSSAASAYRPMIYLVFQSLPLAQLLNQVPFVSAELVASVGRFNLSDVIGAVALRSGYAAGQVVVSGISDQCDGAIELNDFTFQQFLTQLSDPYNFSILDGEGAIKVERRAVGGSLVIDAVLSDTVCLTKSDTDDVVLLDRSEDTQLPYQVEISYLDAAIDYQSTLQAARRPARPVLSTPSIVIKRVDLPLIMTADEALALAYLTLYRGFVEQLKLSFGLPPRYLGIEPGDVVSLSTGGATYTLLILQSTLTPQFGNDLVAKVLLTDISGSWSAISGTTLGSAVRVLALDPNTAVNVTLIHSDLTAAPIAASSAFACVPQSAFKRSGKWYFEATLNHVGANGDSVGIVALGGGVNDPAATTPSNCALVQTGGEIYAEHIDSGDTIGVRSTGDVIRVAVDLDDKLIWFAVAPSGNWNGSPSANPATKAGGISIAGYADATVGPFVAFNAASLVGVDTVNFGQSAFVGTIPSGFAEWNRVGEAPSTGGFTQWNAAASTSNIVIESGALVAYRTSGVGTDGLARSASVRNYGKYYFELTGSGPTNGSAVAGIATEAATAADVNASPPVNCAVVQAVGEIYSDGADSGKTLGSISGAFVVIGVAVDFSAENIWFRISPSGNWNGDPSANPATNTGGISIASYAASGMAPARSWFGGGDATSVLNAGNAPFIGAAPSGFTAGWPA